MLRSLMQPALYISTQSTTIRLKIPLIGNRLCTHITASSLGEKKLAEKLKENLNASKIEVEDISGGCGSMYRIFVASQDFIGKRTIQQHRIINEILKDEVNIMHGLTIETTVP